MKEKRGKGVASVFGKKGPPAREQVGEEGEMFSTFGTPFQRKAGCSKPSANREGDCPEPRWRK